MFKSIIEAGAILSNPDKLNRESLLTINKLSPMELIFSNGNKSCNRSLLSIQRSPPTEVIVCSPTTFARVALLQSQRYPPINFNTFKPFKLVISFPLISTSPSISVQSG